MHVDLVATHKTHVGKSFRILKHHQQCEVTQERKKMVSCTLCNSSLKTTWQVFTILTLPAIIRLLLFREK
jgi:hypothetical protein